MNQGKSKASVQQRGAISTLCNSKYLRLGPKRYQFYRNHADSFNLPNDLSSSSDGLSLIYTLFEGSVSLIMTPSDTAWPSSATGQSKPTGPLPHCASTTNR